MSKPVVFELPGNKPPKKKNNKEPKKLLVLLSVIAVIVLVITAVIGYVLTQAVAIDNEKITIAGEAVPESNAKITDSGFTLYPGDDNSEPIPIDSVTVGSTLNAYCHIEQLDIATSVAIVWVLPDGTIEQGSSLAVNRDGYYYASLNIDDPGSYKAIWTIYKKSSTTNQIEAVEENAGNTESSEEQLEENSDASLSSSSISEEQQETTSQVVGTSSDTSTSSDVITSNKNEASSSQKTNDTSASSTETSPKR